MNAIYQNAGLAVLAALAGLPAASAQACSLSTGQVVINEVLPAPSSGAEWVELYNTTGTDLNIGGCYIDDIAAGGGSPYLIPAGTTVPAYGFWTLDRASYFNNGGDDVRLLKSDAATVLDAKTYGATGYDVSWYRTPDGGSWAGLTTTNPTKGTTNGGNTACGSGTWRKGNLEIHHINIGQGDSTLIVGPTGRSILIDAGETYWNSSQDAITEGAYIQQVLGCKSLDYVLNTHFHNDHIGYVNYGGLWHLVEIQGFTVGQMLHRDYNTYLGTTSGTFTNWKTYLEGIGKAKLHPAIAVEGTGQVNLGTGVSFNIVAVDGNHQLVPGNFSTAPTPPSENDYAIGSVLRYGKFDYWIGGDFSGEFSTSTFGYAYHDIEVTTSDEIKDVDVYRVNHHGSDHSNNPAFLDQLDPEVSIISVGNDNTYGHPRQTVVDRLLATSDVYMTEHGDPNTNTGSAVIGGNIVVKTSNGVNYTVNGNPYVATDPVRIDNDVDGYFWGVDPDDYNFNVMPAYNGGCDLAYQKCLVPPSLTGASAGTRSITVLWNTAPVVDSYRVYRASSAPGPYTLVKSALADAASSWTDTGLSTGNRYYYQMTSIVDGKESIFSGYVTAVAN
ncbi:MAG: lamin tail domain-containing protein [Methylococcaceae bacterium]|nr:lamin tail domain-containing protein [Methylococcaceae bacterium]